MIGYCKFAVRSDFNTCKSVIFNLSKCGTKWVITRHSLKECKKFVLDPYAI